MKNRGVEAILVRIYTVLVIATVLVVLVFAKSICIPLALAGLLAFVLAPLVTRLERWTGRIASVLCVLLLVASCTGLLGYILSQQLVDFASKLPEYHAGIQRKMEHFRQTTGGQYDRFARAAEAIRRDLPGARSVTPPESTAKTQDSVPVTVTVVDPESDAAGPVQSVIGVILDGVALIGLVLLLTVFMLLYREDVRGRILRLAGQGRISLATTAMAETGTRVFRYLVMQLCVNVSFGVAVAIGLYVIGIPNPALWGALAAVLRFIPYVGPWIGACLPILLSMAVSDGWSGVILTVSLFVVLELLTNNVMEPWLYGASTGVSPLALILAAVFWGWLWGGLGLILATPLTVCLVVMGRHIPRLSFLSVLLSDEEPLLPHQECYHRLLRADLTEASALVERYRKNHTLTSLYDEVLIPVLVTAESDHGIDELDRERRSALHQSVRDLLDDQELRATTNESLQQAKNPASEERVEEPRSRRILCLPVRAMRDELAAGMLAQILRERGCTARELEASATAMEMAEVVRREAPDAVCISVVAPSALVHARNLYVKLHAHLPDLPVVVGFWGHTESTELANAFSRWPNVTAATSLEDATRALAGEGGDTSQEMEPAPGMKPAHLQTGTSSVTTPPIVTAS